MIQLAACASAPQSVQLLNSATTSPFAEPVILTEAPFFPQQDYQCGPAALAAVLLYSQLTVSPEDLVPQVYLPGRKGSLQVEMLATARRYNRIAYVLAPALDSVLKEIKQGRPVLVMQNLGLGWYPRWHYAVVIGYDISRSEIILNSGRTERYRISLALFERTWQRADHWAMVVLTPGEVPVDADELTYLSALTAMGQSLSTKDRETAFVAGIQRWPAGTLLPMGLGNSYYEQGDKLAAASQFASALARDPNLAPAHNNLAQVLFELGEKQSALKHAQSAIALGTDHRELLQATLESIQQE